MFFSLRRRGFWGTSLWRPSCGKLTFFLCSLSLLTRLSSRAAYKITLLHLLSFQPFWTTQLMHCRKWSVHKMDKNNTETHRPCTKFSYFKLTFSIVSQLFGSTGPWRSLKIKDIWSQEKDDKDQKMVSHLPRFIFSKTLFKIYFEWMISV